MDLPQFGKQLRALRQQAGWSQEGLIETLDQLARGALPEEYRVIDGTLLSRWEHARMLNGRQWKPTRAYTLHLIHLFAPYLDLPRAQQWAAQAGYPISAAELQAWFPLPATAQPTPQSPARTDSADQIATLPHNLPAALTSFVGREPEMERLLTYLAAPTLRLLTLVGEGGVGKTRLALAIAQRILDLRLTIDEATRQGDTFVNRKSKIVNFPDGLWFVPLAGLSANATGEVADPLATAIAQSLQFVFGDSRESPAAQLIQHLRNKSLLLILDNFEHLTVGIPFVVELLQHAPQVRLLVTSRAALKCQAEQVVWLKGLPAEPVANATPVCVPCVQLFAQRASQQLPDFALTDATVPEIVRLCRWVDGNPLALELAAHWVQHLSVGEIIETLQQQDLDALAVEQHDLPARQRSLRAVFETSWQLLSAQQQRVLVQLSVFRGHFTRQAALAVADATLADLAALVDRSLLHRVEDQPGQSHYLLHELLRQFAAAKFPSVEESVPGLAQQVYQRHSDFYLQLVGTRGQLLYGTQVQAETAEILGAIDNIRVAWRWAVQNYNLPALAQAWFGLRTFYHVRSFFQEGEEVFRSAAAHLSTLAAPSEQVASLLAELQIAHAFFLNLLHRYDEVVALAQQVIQALAGQAETPVLARAQLEWGRALSLQQNNATEALAKLNEAVQLAQRLHLPAIKARALQGMSRVLLAQGDYRPACAVLEQASALYQQVGHRLAQGFVCYALGYSAKDYGDYSRSLHHLEKAQHIYEEADDQARLASLEKQLGETYLALGQLGLAYQSYKTAYAQQTATHDLRETTSMLASFGRLLAHLGEYDLALHYTQQAVTNLHHISGERMASEVRWALGWVQLQRGKAELALAQFRLIVAATQTAALRVYAGLAQLGMGDALVQLGRWAEATSAYRAALTSGRTTGQSQRTLEALSGLAQVAFAQQQQAEALARVEEIAHVLDPTHPTHVSVPLTIYFACYQIWQAAGDPRATPLLAQAYHLLQKQAATLEDESLQRSFLERVAVNRAIGEAFTNAHRR